MRKNKRQDIESYFDDILPNVGCELHYKKDYELLLAVMLSAQTTDISVNNVTKILFNKYDSLVKLKNADVQDIENIIKPIGLYKNKAKNLKNICESLVDNFNCVLPSEKVQLTSLPGIGNKTACVVRAEIFKIPEFPVDTHVERISKKLELADDEDKPIDVEGKLKAYFNSNNWIKLHHQFIHFGREICLAKKPKCDKCKLHDYCKYYKLKSKLKASK